MTSNETPYRDSAELRKASRGRPLTRPLSGHKRTTSPVHSFSFLTQSGQRKTPPDNGPRYEEFKRAIGRRDFFKARHRNTMLDVLEQWELFDAVLAVQDAVARAAFNAPVHHSRSSIMVLAGASSSASPLSTSPPWKCAQRVAAGM
jgi:hypothetical protein